MDDKILLPLSLSYHQWRSGIEPARFSAHASYIAWIEDNSVFVAKIDKDKLTIERKIDNLYRKRWYIAAVGESGSVAIDYPGEQIVVYRPDGRTIRPPVPIDEFGVYERYGVSAAFVPTGTELPECLFAFPVSPTEMLVYSPERKALDVLPRVAVLGETLCIRERQIALQGAIGMYQHNDRFTIVVARGRQVFVLLPALMLGIGNLPFRAIKTRVWKGTAAFLCDTGDVYALSLIPSASPVLVASGEIIDMELSSNGTVLCARGIPPHIVRYELPDEGENDKFTISLDELYEMAEGGEYDA